MSAGRGARLYLALMPARCLAALLAPVALFAQAAEWKVGLAAVDITPAEPVPMAGYAARRAPFEAVAQPLFAKALAIEDQGGTRALLITADLLGFTEERAAAICARLRASDGLAREQVLLNASHTHSGPLVAGSMLTSVPESSRRKLARYSEALNAKIVAAAQKALRDLRPARLAWGKGVASFVMNRREFTERGVILGTNASGAADRTVPVLRVDAPDGSLRAIVFGAAAHCTTLPGGNMLIAGDYAGFAQEFLESTRPGVQAMFMTGCAGDANPYPRGTLDLARRHGSELAAAVRQVLGSGDLTAVRGPLRTTFRRVALPLESHGREQLEAMQEGAPSYRRFFTEGALGRLRNGEAPLPTYSAPFALWRFGSGLTLVAFSGETVVDYVSLTERALGPLDLWVSGYNNDVFGYLPTARILREGGYETRGLYVDYGLFKPEVEGVVLRAIEAMARRVGRLTD